MSNQSTSSCDIIIRNGQIIDGTGAEPVRADLAVRDGHIAKIGVIHSSQGSREIDATGQVISPGFIDIHTHAESNLLKYPDAWNYLSQGVTTTIGGNCGGGPLPVRDYADRAVPADMGINLGLLAGHNAIRGKAMGSENRAPTPAELDRMKALLGEAMEDGAYGFSSGLRYVPGAYAKTDEVIDLARVASAHSVIYVTHMRDEGLGLIESVQESILISREAGLPLQISHFKAVGKKMWGRAGEILGLVDSARAAGQDVTFDQYPYTASSTGLTVLFPSWALAGGRETCLERWKNPDVRKKIHTGIIFSLMEDRGGGDPANVVLVSSPYDAAFGGMHLGEVTDKLFGNTTIENVAEAVIRLSEAGRHPCVFHCMDENDVQRIMQHPAGLIASDSHIVPPDETHPHPRNFGTFPRVLGHYAREQHLFSLPEAIRKMTGAVAQRLDLPDRGLIKKGHRADLTVFDPHTIADRATWTQPKQTAAGIHHVLVNGQVAIENGQPTGKMAGTFLKRTD